MRHGLFYPLTRRTLLPWWGNGGGGVVIRSQFREYALTVLQYTYTTVRVDLHKRNMILGMCTNKELALQNAYSTHTRGLFERPCTMCSTLSEPHVAFKLALTVDVVDERILVERHEGIFCTAVKHELNYGICIL